MTTLVLCTATQIYGSPHTERVADSLEGRRLAAAHIGARRLVWREWRGGATVAIALPPGTRLDRDVESLDTVEGDRWVELER